MHHGTAVTANLNTGWPCMKIWGGSACPAPVTPSISLSPWQPSSAWMDSYSSLHSTIAAPAASPNRTQVPRSCQLMNRLSISAPMTSPYFRGEAASRHSMVCMANRKPLHAPLRSKHTVSWGRPTSRCTRHAAEGAR